VLALSAVFLRGGVGEGRVSSLMTAAVESEGSKFNSFLSPLVCW
jgi:hypothetical protein